MMKGVLYLENGALFEGYGFGAKGTTVGELVFNTSMTGYQEILTDPSYAGQIITMTYPLMGNYGINSLEYESDKIFAQGLVVKSVCKTPSNCMNENTLDYLLKLMNVVGVSDVDTRSITKEIRSVGAMKCIISNEDLNISELKYRLEQEKVGNNFVEKVSTKNVVNIKGTGPRIAVIDFGAKKNIINNLKKRNCDIYVFPHDVSYDKIISVNPDGVLLSNGPGDPKILTESILTVKKLIGRVPIFGICLGHQILALAAGCDTYKMKFGHRGGNHGVYCIQKDRAYISSQNHGYAVDEKSIQDRDIEVTFRNLNDGTVEGIRHKKLPIFSVQFHPEASPGPMDTSYLFDDFISMVNLNNNKTIKNNCVI